MEKKYHVILMIIANVLWIAAAHVVNDNIVDDSIVAIYGAASMAIIIGDILFFIRKYSLHNTNK